MLEKIEERGGFVKGKMESEGERGMMVGRGVGSVVEEMREKYEMKYWEMGNLGV